MLPLGQEPVYEDPQHLWHVCARLKEKPPLVGFESIRSFQERLFDIVDHKGFLLQLGECAETFVESTPSNTLKHFLFFKAAYQRIKMEGPVVISARMAGQFAKPRSVLFEFRDGGRVPNYHGDLINDRDCRTPNPDRMLWGYRIARDIIQTFAENPDRTFRLGHELFTTHEAYLLSYESALCRWDATGGEAKAYATSAHSLWVGDRTRSPQGGHVHFLSGLENPIAVKIGTTITLDEAKALCQKLNPLKKKGRLMFVCRLGVKKIAQILPGLLCALKDEPILWMCDPMHGNTQILSHGFKTRVFTDIKNEVIEFFRILKKAGIHPSGLHVEASANEDVTECLDRARGIDEGCVSDGYTSACDPRLNPAQTYELLDLCGELQR